MARAQKLLSPVRVSGDLSDLGTQQWTMTLDKSGFIIPIKTITANYTVTEDDNTILVDTSGGDVTVTVYSSGSNAGAHVTIKRIENSAGTDVTNNNVVTISAEGSDKFDGLENLYLQRPFSSVTLVTEGANWFVV